MNVAAWEHVWQSGVMLFVQEPVQFRVVVTVGAAFLALMVVEGLRASFIPRHTKRAVKSRAQSITEPSSGAAPNAAATPRGFASTTFFPVPPDAVLLDRRTHARRFVLHNRKRDVTRPRTHRNMLPKIRRMVTARDADSRSG